MKVLKFGGTSVGSAENILKVIDIIKSQKGGKVVIVSAIGGITNKLEALGDISLKGDFQDSLDEIKRIHFDTATELLGKLTKSQSEKLNSVFSRLQNICSGVSLLQELSERTKAMILSTGEECSSFIVSESLKKKKVKNELLDSKLLVKTNNDFLRGIVDYKKTNSNIKKSVNTKNLYIAPGFIASSNTHEITTLGRGGSDYTAAIFAGAINAEALEIWSDVDGMMTANPRFVKQANSIQILSYNEALELSHFGAKVLFPFAINPVLKKKIPLLLKNTFQPDYPGTLVLVKPDDNRASEIAGISSINKVALVTVSGVGMAGNYGFSARIFGAMQSAHVNVVLITQSCSENNICFGIDQKAVNNAVKALEDEFELERMKGTIDPIKVDKELSIVAVVGDKMKYQPGVSGNTFSALGENGINIRAIAQGASERNISIVIDHINEKKALNVLHEKFFSRASKTVHLFVIGTGNVGKKFLDILNDQKNILADKYNLTLKLAGITNSRYMKINAKGISTKELNDFLVQNKGEKADLDLFIDQMKELNLRNSILIDNTANANVCDYYNEVLEKSISVVACNKISLSRDYQEFVDLRSHAEKRNVEFRFETTVGASLPVINTIEDLIHSGDQIISIDAVLSGSLNFIFNHYDGKSKFSEIVKRADKEGYTEPDPREDLSGMDVLRKVLILARVSGYPLKESQIKREPLFDEKAVKKLNVSEFLKWLSDNEDSYKKVYEKAQRKGMRLKYVASFDGKRGRVGLQEIPEDHPFYNLEGKDSIVMIHTERYKEEPLVIKGAGAGAELTAAGVFSDILRIVNR